MYYKLNDKELELINKLSNITSTNYELEGDMFPMDSFICLLEDLKWYIDYQEEQLEDIKRDIEDNYRPISYEEQIGYNSKDFC